MAAQQYDLSIQLSWSHFLTVPGKAAPQRFGATSAATFTALRSTTCLVLHSQGLNYSQVPLLPCSPLPSIPHPLSHPPRHPPLPISTHTSHTPLQF